MDFDKELEAFRKRVLHLEKDSDTNYLPLPEDNNLDMQLNTPASNPQSGDILFYQTPDENISVSVYFFNETFWMSQKTIAQLFDVDITTINYHIKEIYDSKELTENSTIGIFPIVQLEGSRHIKRNVKHYNLDMIISIGYRVNSIRATKFRQWTTNTLKEYIIKGFVINDDMLKNGKPFGKDYFYELLERIKEIRASERRFYQKITDIYSQCSYDYDKDSDITKTFFKTVQNKLLFAVTQKTAPEIIHSRVDSSKEHLGLSTWKNAPDGKILKSDVTVSKNYLTKKELSSLNDIVTMYLDYAENQAKRNKLMSMQDWVNKLDAFLNFNEYDILHNSGYISRELANTLALKEYSNYRIKQDAEFVSDFDKEIKKYL